MGGTCDYTKGIMPNLEIAHQTTWQVVDWQFNISVCVNRKWKLADQWSAIMLGLGLYDLAEEKTGMTDDSDWWLTLCAP